MCVCWEKTLLGLLWLFVCWNNTNWGIGINIISTLSHRSNSWCPYIFWNIDIQPVEQGELVCIETLITSCFGVSLSPLCSFGTLIVDTKTSLSISLMDGRCWWWCTMESDQNKKYNVEKTVPLVATYRPTSLSEPALEYSEQSWCGGAALRIPKTDQSPCWLKKKWNSKKKSKLWLSNRARKSDNTKHISSQLTLRS